MSEDCCDSTAHFRNSMEAPRGRGALCSAAIDSKVALDSALLLEEKLHTGAVKRTRWIRVWGRCRTVALSASHYSARTPNRCKATTRT